jgi:nitrite reductase (NADH) small subunit/3-phenylpropionate/trans-cinnamate dioxygenase ferredoxin subunit
MAELHTVCKLGELPDGDSKVVQAGNRLIAVFNDGGKFCAIDDCCPHMGASLAGGHVENGIVTCPWHAWRFRLSDGTWADNPRIKTGAYPVTVVGDEVKVEIPDKKATPPPAT